MRLKCLFTARCFRSLNSITGRRILTIDAQQALSRVRSNVITNSSIPADIKSDFFNVLDAFQDETKAAKDETKDEIKASKDEIKAAKDETLAATISLIEKTTLYERLSAELKESNRMILKSQGELSVRGALEYIRSRILASRKKKATALILRNRLTLFYLNSITTLTSKRSSEKFAKRKRLRGRIRDDFWRQCGAQHRRLSMEPKMKCLFKPNPTPLKNVLF